MGQADFTFEESNIQKKKEKMLEIRSILFPEESKGWDSTWKQNEVLAKWVRQNLRVGF